MILPAEEIYVSAEGIYVSKGSMFDERFTLERFTLKRKPSLFGPFFDFALKIRVCGLL